MKRALRRHQQNVAKIRRIRMLYNYFGFFGRRRLLDTPWRAINCTGEWLMREPGWWNHEMTIAPSRIRSNRLLHRLLAEDPEGLIWPDYHRPHIYYW